MATVQTLKGFRDFLPKDAKKRQYVINTLKSVFASYGFEPLETPALEYEEILLGKYGEEGDKLMYRFVDNGDRKVALRYDQTVPLARIVAQYQNDLVLPFKRYQVQPVWRAENTQKGRFREFLQCDSDIVGSSSPLADAEIIALAFDCLSKLGFKDFLLLGNDRAVFSNLVEQGLLSEEDVTTFVRSLDKIKKIGKEKVLEEMIEKGIPQEAAAAGLDIIQKTKPTPYLDAIARRLDAMGVNPAFHRFDPTLARGLDYYTGLIFEIEIKGYTGGSIAGGGRYDNLIGMFAGRQIPAVGFAFGFDRLMEAMEELDLFPKDIAASSTKVLVTIFNPELKTKSLEAYATLRSKNIPAEIYLDEDTKMEKQLKYADQKGIPYVVIIGSQEAEKNLVTLKNLATREQKEVPFDTLPNELT